MQENKIDYPFIDINELKPYENNARLHPQEQINKIVNSIKEFGFITPVIIDENNTILVGHGRTQAAKAAGLTKVPYRRITNLTDEQKRAYILADNKLSDIAEWDEELLQMELESISLDMTAFGFDDFTIDIDEDAEAEVVEDEVPEPPEEPRAQLGDLYKLGKHRLLCGDSTDALNIDILMNGKKADMVFTDPPYGMDLDTDFSSMKNRLDFAKEKNFTGGKKYEQGKVDDFTPEMVSAAVTIEAQECFLWGADYFAELLPDKNSGSWIVWDKRANGNDDIEQDYSSDKMYGSCFELCWSKKKHKRDIARVKWAGVFGTEQEFDHKRHHPTQKPIKLAAWFLERYSKEGDLVVDIFGGSGSTLIACEQLGRTCYMCELDPKYVDVIIERWENLTGQKAELIKGGE